MLLIVISGAIITIGYILKNFFDDMSRFESDAISPSIKDPEETSSSYEAIKKALENGQNS